MSWWIWVLIGLVALIVIVVIAVRVAIDCVCESFAGMIVNSVAGLFKGCLTKINI